MSPQQNSNKLFARFRTKISRPMNLKQSFVSTWAFRLAVGMPVISAIGLITWVSANSNLSPSFTVEGLSYFYDHFKLPLGISTLAIPLGALVASHHRSLQTSRQLERQEDQNRFANHIEHKKGFREFFDEIAPLKKFSSWNSWQLYESLFPEAHNGELNASPKVQGLIDIFIGFQKNLLYFLENKYDNGFPDAQVENIEIIKVTINTEIYNLTGIEVGVRSFTAPDYLFVNDVSHEIYYLAHGIIACASFQHTSVLPQKTREINKNHEAIKDKANEIKCRKDLAGAIEDLFSMNDESNPGGEKTLSTANKFRLIELLSDAFRGKSDSEKKKQKSKLLKFDLSEKTAERLKTISNKDH